MPLNIAMVVPPTVNLNTPYAAAPRLAGWLRHLGHEVVPLDVSLALFLRLMSRDGLSRMFDAVDPRTLDSGDREFYRNRDRYERVVDDAIALLQLRDLSAASQVVRGTLIPVSASFHNPPDAALLRDPGRWSTTDLARFIVSLMVSDLLYFFQQHVTPHIDGTSYAAKLATAIVSFDPLAEELAKPPNVYVAMLEELAAEMFPAHIDLVCITCPFPGNLVGALLLGRWLKRHRPGVPIALGGGYPSTELRALSEPRLFDYVDYVVIDDGEPPLRQICARLQGEDAPLHTTFVREDGRVVFHGPSSPPVPFRSCPPPSYQGFALDRYVHTVFRENPLQRSNDGVWLKITAAHGCYWKKCTFCDISLPYIGDFDPMPARQLADQMDAMHEETGRSGFHFTDEAAPPSLLINLALELIRRQRNYHWWGNIRYDKAFEPDRCRLLAAGGMIAAMGGIEAASDSVLEKIKKGVSVHQLVKVLQAFTDAGIKTHAYLIYGFPGETVLDSVNGLEILRQLISAGLLSTTALHLLSVTVHAPLGKDPEQFQIKLLPHEPSGFAHNMLPFAYNDGVPRNRKIYDGIRIALNHFERGRYLDDPVVDWFPDQEVPAPTFERDFVATVMEQPHPGTKQRQRLCWLGGVPEWSRGLISVRSASGAIITSTVPKRVADNIARCHPGGWVDGKPPTVSDFDDVEWTGALRDHGLVVV